MKLNLLALCSLFATMLPLVQTVEAAPVESTVATAFAEQVLSDPDSKPDALVLVTETLGKPPEREQLANTLRRSLTPPGATLTPELLARIESDVQKNIAVLHPLISNPHPSMTRFRSAPGIFRLDSVTRLDGSIPNEKDPFQFVTIVRSDATGRVIEHTVYDLTSKSKTLRPVDAAPSAPSWTDFQQLPTLVRTVVRQIVATELGLEMPAASHLDAARVVEVITRPDNLRKTLWRFEQGSGENGTVFLEITMPNMAKPMLRLEFANELKSGRDLRLTSVEFRDKNSGAMLFSRRNLGFDQNARPNAFSLTENDLNGNLLRRFDVSVDRLTFGNEASDDFSTVQGLFMETDVRNAGK